MFPCEMYIFIITLKKTLKKNDIVTANPSLFSNSVQSRLPVLNLPVVIFNQVGLGDNSNPHPYE